MKSIFYHKIVLGIPKGLYLGHSALALLQLWKPQKYFSV